MRPTSPHRAALGLLATVLATVLAVTLTVTPFGPRAAASPQEFPPAPPAAAPVIERFVLDNGLTVILRPLAAAPTVALVTLFDLGELHDPPGQSGFAHLLEHVYITAASGPQPAASAEAWFARYGGQANAQTGRDYTVFAGVFPAGRLEAELTEAAARMGRLDLTPADLVRELPRLNLELQNMYGGMPQLAASNLARDAAVPLAPGARKGGILAQVRTITAGELSKAHRRYYKPVNATVVLVGGFDPVPVRARIEALYADLPAGETPPASRPAAPPVTGGTRRMEVPDPGFAEPSPSIASIAYRAPDPDDELYPSFLFLTAYLYQWAMPQFQTARRVAPVAYAVLDDPSVLFLSGIVRHGESDEEAVAILRNGLREVTTIPEDEPPSSMVLFGMFGPYLGLTPLPEPALSANPYFTAFSLGRMEQLGLESASLEARLRGVTTGQLRRCAETLLRPEHGAAVVVRVTSP